MSTSSSCVGCDRPFRPKGTTKLEHPGTVRRDARNLCHWCYVRDKGYQWTKNLRGVNRVDWHAMLVAQSGLCGACGHPMTGKRDPVIDHDHATGVIRGMLCWGCNVAEGHLKGDPVRMRALAAYMERHASGAA